MAHCSYCSTTILFGALEDGGKVFCSDRCRDSERLLERAEQVSPKVIVRKMDELHQGRCPKCRGPGPCDVYRTYKVWSFLLMTKWTNIPQLCRRRCGRQSQVEGILVSLLLGWWGLPWGFIITPLQVARNLRALFRSPDPTRPSHELENSSAWVSPDGSQRRRDGPRCLSHHAAGPRQDQRCGRGTAK